MKRTHATWSVLIAAVIIACEGEEPAPEVTLDYEPVQFLITGAIDVDALAEGATISLSMREGGFVTGSLFMPAATTGGTDLMADLAGTWVKRGDTVLFNQVSQTFVSEVPWILEPQFLSAADSVAGSFYDVVLERIF